MLIKCWKISDCCSLLCFRFISNPKRVRYRWENVGGGGNKTISDYLFENERRAETTVFDFKKRENWIIVFSLAVLSTHNKKFFRLTLAIISSIKSKAFLSCVKSLALTEVITKNKTAKKLRLCFPLWNVAPDSNFPRAIKNTKNIFEAFKI